MQTGGKVIIIIKKKLTKKQKSHPPLFVLKPFVKPDVHSQASAVALKNQGVIGLFFSPLGDQEVSTSPHPMFLLFILLLLFQLSSLLKQLILQTQS